MGLGRVRTGKECRLGPGPVFDEAEEGPTSGEESEEVSIDWILMGEGCDDKVPS